MVFQRLGHGQLLKYIPQVRIRFQLVGLGRFDQAVQ